MELYSEQRHSADLKIGLVGQSFYIEHALWYGLGICKPTQRRHGSVYFKCNFTI